MNTADSPDPELDDGTVCEYAGPYMDNLSLNLGGDMSILGLPANAPQWGAQAPSWQPEPDRPTAGHGPYYDCVVRMRSVERPDGSFEFVAEGPLCYRGPYHSVAQYHYTQTFYWQFRVDRMTGQVEACSDCELATSTTTLGILLVGDAAQILKRDFQPFEAARLSSDDVCAQHPLPPAVPGGG